MFKRGFFKGLVTGSILGVLANLFVSPERKPLFNTRDMRKQMQSLEEEAKDAVDEKAGGISGLWKK